MSESTDPEERIAELELQVKEVREAAFSIIFGISDAMAQSAERRAEVAQGFEEVVQHDAPAEMQRVARLLAAALRMK